MKFGTHVSIAGGIENAPINAHAMKCEVFQFFSRSPRGGQPKYTKETFTNFKANCQKYGFTDYYIHAPYYINLASSNDRIRIGSIKSLRDELEVGTAVGAKYMMFHIGSAKDFSDNEALALVVEGINEIMKGYKGTTEMLIEMSAGAGQIIGDTFEEIASILKKTKNKNIGVCFDTCHAFASGYDLRTSTKIKETFEQFDNIIGLDKLKLFHLNDSKTELGSHKDRHENLGDGFIGKKGISEFINYSKIKQGDAVLETPDTGEVDCPSLALVKRIRQ